MAVTKVPARSWTIEVSDGGTPTPTWLPIGGVESMTIAEGDVAEADTTDRDDAGIATHLVMERRLSITIEGNLLIDPTDGSRDPGQAEVEAVGRAVGLASLRAFRFTAPGGAVRTQDMSVRLQDYGGGLNDEAQWGAELVRSGATAVS